jgi:hypothetical protein
MMHAALHLWLNIALLFVVVGLGTYATCLRYTTFYGDDE